MNIEPLFYRAKKGLTLAEVILTLAIVGSISSFTIPNLVYNVQDKVFKVAWKRKYSQLEQVSRRVIAENGGLDSFFTTNDKIRDAFLNYMKYLKKQNNSVSDGNCWHAGNSWTLLNGTSLNGASGSQAIINDGTLILFHVNKAVLDAGGACAPNTVCGYIFIDVNGFSKPNRVGADVFGVNFYTSYISPYGSDKAVMSGTCSDAQSGWGCAADYLRQ